MLVVFFLAIKVQALFFTLPGETKYCFSIDCEKSRKLWGAFMVSGAGDQNVLTTLHTAQGVEKYKGSPREGKFEEIVEVSQEYTLCFKALDYDEKTISFEYSQDQRVNEDDIAGEDQFVQLNDEGATSSKLLEAVYRGLCFYETRERVHRDLTERTCDGILMSVLVKILVLCGLSVSEIVVFKRLFSFDKNKV